MLGLSPLEAPVGSGDLPPPLELPASATGADGRRVSIAPVPRSPPSSPSNQLLGDAQGIGPEESYSRDEVQLNNFLKLHPMLSMEACSQRTLQMLSSMFEKASVQSTDLPCVSKSHDDKFLRPPNEAIGERACLNGEHCLARFVAQLRYGVETDMAFTCTEFLLPDAHRAFLDGKGLPARRGKCLMCCRYFMNYIYILARTRF
jgi:hypothetical protein